MISVYFGDDRSAIINIDMYFNNVFEQDWLDDPIVREMIHEIDNSVVLSRHCIQSPILGQIPPERLSGSVKALICLWKQEDVLIDLMVCGENCNKWLSYIAKNKDIRVSMSSYDLSFEGLPISGICENDNSVINSNDDWVDKMCDMAGDPENVRS